MKENKFTERQTARWKQFNHKSYAVFCSLKKEVNIGVLAISTLAFANVECASAQTETPLQLKEYKLDEIEVTGSRVPLTLGEAARIVTVLSREDIQAAAVQSINELLKYAVGVDVRQRGDLGIQTDISIRGGTSDQITILLNGANISNPQTGHLTADFPVDMNDIERIEILEGPAARVYGTSAFTGAINIVTKSDKQSHAAIDLSTGQYGLFNGGVRGNFTKGRLSNQLSGGYSRSDGYIANSDFNTKRVFYQGEYSGKEADIRWQAGISDKGYGANTFYSAAYPNQYEHTRKYSVSVQAETKGRLHFTPIIYWNRGNDRFELFRNNPASWYTNHNYHQTDVFGTNLNTYFKSTLGKTAFGAEFRNEGVLSNVLGKLMDEPVKIPGEGDHYFTKKDNRTNVSYYVEHDILLPRFTLSLGLMATMNTGLDNKFRYYPGVDASYRLTEKLKVYASWSMALRLPTFTDLYYESKTLQGNPNLKPEETKAFEIGTKYSSHILQASVCGYYHKGKNMIDWVKYSSDDKWHTMNHTKLDNMGIETSATLNFCELFGNTSFLKKANIGYSYINQDKVIGNVYESNYSLDYLKHKFVAQLDHRIWRNLSANWAFRWQSREGSYAIYEGIKEVGKKAYPSFCLVDLKLSWNAKNYLLFAEANNLLNRNYYDLGNIPQPGIWGKVGVSYRINFK
jgi:iron complex outermembrane receptor protein